MNPRWAFVIIATVALACGTDREESAMSDMSGDEHAQMAMQNESGAPTEGMTAEEHAKMQSGASDSTGAPLREPVHLTPEEERTLGVVYGQVSTTDLGRSIRTVGIVQPAEPLVVDVTPKIGGFIEVLHVDFTGDEVRRGQTLLTLYSPQLVAAQEELLTARRLAEQVDSGAKEAWRSAQRTLEAARRRLSYWDITEKQVEALETTGVATKTLALVSPVDGIVLEKLVVEGQFVPAGSRLYRLADLREIWVEGEVFEQDLQFIREGAPVQIEIAAYPGRSWTGRVAFVYPVVDPRSRTNRIRITVPNRNLTIRPGMYATLNLDVTVGRDVISVPLEAVILTGQRNIVFVRDADGMLRAREVKLGARADGRVTVLDGLTDGETIVLSANFLIDAESRLGSAGGMPGMPGMDHSAPEPKSDTTSEPQHD